MSHEFGTWIKTQDEYPPTGKICLTWDENLKEMDLVLPFIYNIETGEKSLFSRINGDVLPSHWMPLPISPKESSFFALFAEYARWDKKRRDYVGSGAKEKSDFFRRVLSKRRLPKLTEVLARKVYKELHSGGMRTRRFGSDATFVKSNALHKIKQSLAYLLWADANVQIISALLGAGRYRLNEFGPSNVQELLGWVNPKMPIRNEKANKALELSIPTPRRRVPHPVTAKPVEIDAVFEIDAAVAGCRGGGRPRGAPPVVGTSAGVRGRRW